MGCFSWLCSDCDEQIVGPNYDSRECFKCEKESQGTERVVLLMPDGEDVHGFYDNYGRFGFETKNCWQEDEDIGLDAYAWLARVNAPEQCPIMLTPTGRVKRGKAFWEASRTTTCDEDRYLGIDLAFNKGITLKYPIKVVHERCLTSYEYASASDSDPDQGWADNGWTEEGSLMICGDCW